jgi:hypothetical protein
MSDQNERVECNRHGPSYATFVCQHLASGGSELGFFCNTSTDDPRPEAWCAKCDAVMMADGEWNEQNEKAARITLLCSNCYDEAKARNRSPH